jgi:hypothetical protein
VKVSPENVVLYRTAEQVPGRYEEVAILRFAVEDPAFGLPTNEEDKYTSLRKKAGELGANAIILVAVEEPSTGEQILAELFGAIAVQEGKAIAIYVFALQVKFPDNLKDLHPGTYKVGQDTLRCNPVPDGWVERWWATTPAAGITRVGCDQPGGAGTTLFLREDSQELVSWMFGRGCGACMITLTLHTTTSIPGDAGLEVARDSVAVTIVGP